MVKSLGMARIKVPVLAIHSRTDNVADPQSEYYIARFSSAPYTKILWFGDEHTPLIHPNAEIFAEISSFIHDPEYAAAAHQLAYDAKNTEIIKNEVHHKPFSAAYNFSYTNQNNEEYLLEIPAPDYGERTNFLYSRKGNKRMLGWGLTSGNWTIYQSSTVLLRLVIDFRYSPMSPMTIFCRAKSPKIMMIGNRG